MRISLPHKRREVSGKQVKRLTVQRVRKRGLTFPKEESVLCLQRGFRELSSKYLPLLSVGVCFCGTGA